MPPRNQETHRDSQRKTRSAASASAATENRRDRASRKPTGGRKQARSAMPSAEQAASQDSQQEPDSNMFRGADIVLEAARIMVPHTPFESCTMPPPLLPVAARLSKAVSPAIAATASPKEPFLTPGTLVPDRQETASPRNEDLAQNNPQDRRIGGMLVAERAASTSNSNLHGLEQLEDAGASDDDLTESYTVYSEHQTPTS